MSSVRIRYTLLSMLLGFGFIASAATDNFTVSSFISSDTTPPSVPTNLTTTPIAATQIDLSWSTSTDNHMVSGYQVFRDGSQIATSSLTSYSDTGLTASTTYAYYVTAFDVTGNISASSTEVSTTTLALPPPTPTSTPATSTIRYGTRIAPIEIVRLEIIPDTDSVTIRYETKAYVRPTIKWGTTFSYELGSLLGQAYKKNHETKITGLTPGTRYYFTIEGETNSGRRGLLTESTFTTLEGTDIFPPGNVTNLRAEKSGSDIVLTWKNPTDPDFAQVRVLRSETFYPSDIADGWIVYEGRETKVRDTGAAIPNTRQFYTVFSYDALGNISSGAIVAIRIGADGVGEVVDVVDIVDETLNPLDISFGDLEFFQDGEKLTVKEGNQVVINGTKALVISLPYERVPEHLKTILVSIENGNDGGAFSFLLRVNREKNAYTATLAPLGIAGTFPLSLTVFDFKTTQTGYAKGELLSQIAYFQTPEQDADTFIGYVIEQFIKTRGSLLFLVGVVLIFLLLGLKRTFTHRRGA